MYAAGLGPPPTEYETMQAVEKYGVQAIYGRPIGARELYVLEFVQDIIKGKIAMENAANMVEWKNANPHLSGLVHFARNIALELDMVTEND